MADFTGTDGNDVVAGTDDNDNLYGLGGADFLKGFFGDDYIDGGDGNDRAAYYLTNPAFGGVTVSLLLQGQAQNTGAQGWDTLVNIESLSGTPFSDTLTGDNNDNWLWGSPATLGNGSISSLNNDFLYGMGGNDLLVVGIGNHTIDGGTETDTLRFTENGSPEGPVTINLQLQGQAQDTGQGNWIVTGIENLSGGTANDTLGGNSSANVLAGDSGNDSLIGRGGDDILYGDGRIATNADNVITTTADVAALGDADGNDALQGGFGNDQLYGGGGNDVLNGGFDNDIVDGGDGNDRAGFYQSDPNLGGVTVSLMLQGTAQNTGQGMDTLSNIEHLSGTPFSDNLTGDGGDNWLWGSAATYFDGTSNVISLTNNDFLYGLGGNDLLTVGIGNHMIDGGADNDTLQFGENGAPEGGITVNLNQQDGTAQNTGQGNWILLGIENVSAGIGNDVLSGDGNANILAGSGGNDQLNGGGGDDTLYGDGRIATSQDQVITTTPDVVTLNDPAIPGKGNDTLNGGAGNDLLLPGRGVDKVDGGTENDTLIVDYSALTTAVKMTAPSPSGNGSISGSKTDSITFQSVETFSITTGSGGDSIYTGSGNDTIATGAGNDFVMPGGGIDHVATGDGADTIDFERALTSGDFVDGGAGSDSLYINGGGSLVLANVTGIELLNLITGIFNLTSVDANLVSGAVLSIEASNLGTSESLFFDGSAETDGSFYITSGRGNDTLIGGAQADTIRGGAGADTIAGGGGDDVMTGGNGVDTFTFGASSGHDRITDFTSSDKIAFDTTSGVTSFAQLTVTQVGKDTVISWGTSDNITLAGVKASTVNASEFQFGASAPAVVQQTSLTLDTSGLSNDHSQVHALFANSGHDLFFA